MGRHDTPSRGVRFGSAEPLRTPARSGERMKLTERKIETLSVDRGRKDRLVFDAAQRGLAVRATASGGRTYLCQYTLNAPKRRGGPGSLSPPSLSLGGPAPPPPHARGAGRQ